MLAGGNAPGASACSPDTSSPPPPNTVGPPLNKVGGGPGVSPQDNEAGMSEQLQASVPMSGGSAGSEAARTQRVE